MKKALLIALCAIMACGSALAQTPGNLNNGAFTEQYENSLYIALEDGIWKTDLDGKNAALICEGRASYLQVYDGRLYYVRDVYGENEYGEVRLMEQTPMSCLLDGGDNKQLGEARKVGYSANYPEEEFGFIERDEYVGYRCFTVYDGYIYFLGNSDEGGRYTCAGTWYDENDNAETQSVDGVYYAGIKLYRMEPDGSKLTPLTGVIGNDTARMAIADGKIYLAGGYMDTVYAYNYVNYMILDIQNNTLERFVNPVKDRENLYSDAGEFYHNVSAVLPDGGNMLLSLFDSEGDFIASQLNRLTPSGELSLLVIEQEYVPSIVMGSDLYYVGSASTTNYYEDGLNYADSLGIYRKDLTEAGMGIKLVALPFTDFMYSFRMNVTGDYVYYIGNTGLLYRVGTEGGALQALTDAGFERAVVN